MLLLLFPLLLLLLLLLRMLLWLLLLLLLLSLLLLLLLPLLLLLLPPLPPLPLPLLWRQYHARARRRPPRRGARSSGAAPLELRFAAGRALPALAGALAASTEGKVPH